jgi:hypothetical protein
MFHFKKFLKVTRRKSKISAVLHSDEKIISKNLIDNGKTSLIHLWGIYLIFLGKRNNNLSVKY